jgi:transposase-like protein
VASGRTLYQVAGQGTQLYRAVDKAGRTVDFRFSKRRDGTAAKTFFHKAIRHEGRSPQTVTLVGYAASPRAVREMKTDDVLPRRTRLRTSKYLNNTVEQDHRGIKSRTLPMLGFKSFSAAVVTIAGVELLRLIHQAQFSLAASASKFMLRPHSRMQCSMTNRKPRRQKHVGRRGIYNKATFGDEPGSCVSLEK